jgi:uncharacterized phage-associated protein
MASLTAQEVADYFLASVDSEVGDNLSNLKLQKLLYYAQGFHLALHGTPLFGDPIQAWAHGPVVPSVYHRYKAHGSGAIPGPSSFDPDRYDGEVRSLLDEILQVYGQFSAWKLRDMTHVEPPWAETELNRVISHDAMRDYFQTLVIDGPR